MDLSQIASELQGPPQKSSRLPIPTERAWGRRVVQMLLSVMPDGKLEDITSEKSRNAVNGDMGIGSTMGDRDKMARVHITMDHLPPSATQRIEYTSMQPEAAGKLELAGHVNDHYQMGMHPPISVTK